MIRMGINGCGRPEMARQNSVVCARKTIGNPSLEVILRSARVHLEETARFLRTLELGQPNTH
jgi:hypothetical protein